MLMLNRLACLCPMGQGHTQGHFEKLFSIPIACGRGGVNVNEIGTGRSGIICGQFGGVG